MTPSGTIQLAGVHFPQPLSPSIFQQISHAKERQSETSKVFFLQPRPTSRKKGRKKIWNREGIVAVLFFFFFFFVCVSGCLYFYFLFFFPSASLFHFLSSIFFGSTFDFVVSVSSFFVLAFIQHFSISVFRCLFLLVLVSPFSLFIGLCLYFFALSLSAFLSLFVSNCVCLSPFSVSVV